MYISLSDLMWLLASNTIDMKFFPFFCLFVFGSPHLHCILYLLSLLNLCRMQLSRKAIGEVPTGTHDFFLQFIAGIVKLKVNWYYNLSIGEYVTQSQDDA